MNPTVIPNSQWAAIWNFLGFGGIWSGNYHIHLYKNDVTPNASSALGDFIEADFTGYSAQLFGFWDSPRFDTDGVSIMQSGAWQFNATLPLSVANTVYGWYVTDGTDAQLWFAQRFTSPVVVTFSGALLLPLVAVPRIPSTN